MRVLKRVQRVGGVSEVIVRRGEVRLVLCAISQPTRRQDHGPRRPAPPGPVGNRRDQPSKARPRSDAKVRRDKARATAFRERQRRHQLRLRLGGLLRRAVRTLRMARLCLHFMCEQARHCARAAEQPPNAAGGMAQGSAGLSDAAPSPHSFLPGFASGFLGKKSGCTGLGASSSSPRRRARQASPPDVLARPQVSVADCPRGKKPRQGDG
jgi:hypothetical protein